MARQPNTNRVGQAWTEQQKLAVWNKGRIIPDFSNSLWRWDKCGKVMKYTEFGNRNSDYGWEIDHILAVANNGGDEIGNLQPLYWVIMFRKAINLTGNVVNRKRVFWRHT